MTTATKARAPPPDRDLVLTRMINAPREKVVPGMDRARAAEAMVHAATLDDARRRNRRAAGWREPAS